MHMGILRFLSIDALIAGIQGADIIGNSESTIGTLWLIVDMTILDKAIGIVSAICGFLSEGKRQTMRPTRIIKPQPMATAQVSGNHPVC